MNTAITIKKVAEYLGVFNAKGQEVGGIYPGTMNLVMFRQDKGMFESLDAAIEAANAINVAHMNVIGKIEARLSADGVEFTDESAAVQCLSECVAPSMLTRAYQAEMEVRKAPVTALLIGQEVETVDGRLFFVVALLDGEQVKLRHVSDTYSITTSLTNIKGYLPSMAAFADKALTAMEAHGFTASLTYRTRSHRANIAAVHALRPVLWHLVDGHKATLKTRHSAIKLMVYKMGHRSTKAALNEMVDDLMNAFITMGANQ